MRMVNHWRLVCYFIGFIVSARLIFCCINLNLTLATIYSIYPGHLLVPVA
jgi:hypothetical protein